MKDKQQPQRFPITVTYTKEPANLEAFARALIVVGRRLEYETSDPQQMRAA